MENKIRIKWFESLDSTNSELLRHLSDYDNLSVIAAWEQYAGRGQRGNRWTARPGENLTFSLLLRLEGIPAGDFMSVTHLTTLVIREWLRGQGVPAVIKWPNDMYVGGRKICGILIENGLQGSRLDWSVIGIGLNLNQTEFPGELVNPTSLRRLTGKEYDVKRSLEEICSIFENRLPAILEKRESLYEEYGKDLFQAGLPCRYRDLVSGEEFVGKITGVSWDGRLLMEREGKTVSFAFKEVGYIL